MPLRYHKICNAKKRDGSPCGMVAIRGQTKCKMHGGKSLRGMAHPSYKTGKYSKVLPIRLQSTYEAALENPELLSLRHDVAICEARLAELFQRLDSGESGAVWEQLGTAHAAFEAALSVGNRPGMRVALEQLRHLIAQGATDYAIWDDVRAVWESRCKLTLAEHKTILLSQQVMTAEALSAFLGALTSSIRERVFAYATPDVATRILSEISTDLIALSLREDGAGPRPIAQA